VYATATRFVRGDGGVDEGNSDSVAGYANDVCSAGDLVAFVSHVGAANR